MFKHIYKLIGLFFLTLQIQAQLTIDLPINKSIFQRNLNNQGTIPIAGFFQNTDGVTVQARLLNPADNQPINGFDWTTIQSGITLKHYSGSLTNVPGGWYFLQVRVLNASNSELTTSSVNRVGIGEVFVIAGQSNSQGIQDHGSISANDERVQSVNFSNYQYLGIPDFPNFSKIEYNSGIATRGNSSWSWGQLGDLIAFERGVPVAFFNTGASGSSTQNWKESADNLPTNFVYTGQQYAGVVGMPYAQLRNVLKYYASLYGVRSILWHQGETDTHIGTSTQTYYDNLSYVIHKTRNEFNANLPWVISRASYVEGNTSSQVIGGQNTTIQNMTNAFYGPETDGIQPRLLFDPEGNNVHFEGSTLITLANEWRNSLNNSNVFSNATPIQANTYPNITITCNTSNYSLSAPSGYSSYKWIRIDTGNDNFEQSAFSTNRTISVTGGIYRCYATNWQGLISVSNKVNVNLLPPAPSPPIISSNINPAVITQGNSITLTATGCSSPNILKWSDNVTSTNPYTITPTSSISYSAKCINSCSVESGSSNTIQIVVTSPTSCDIDSAYLSDFPIISSTNGYGPVRIDKNTDGGTITLNGVTFEKGFGIQTNSEIIIDIPSNYFQTLTGTVGIDDAITANCGDIIFRIYGDNTLLYTSPTMTPLSTNENFTVNLENYSHIKLVADKINVDFCDRGDWADMKLIREITIPNAPVISSNITPPTINSGQPITLTATGCSSPNIIKWSDNQLSSPITITPTSTVTYTAKCVNTSGCESANSNEITISVNTCQTDLSLVSPPHDYGSTDTVELKVSQTIEAANKILDQANITYSAGQSVTLKPGFVAENGTLFTAKIGGCSQN